MSTFPTINAGVICQKPWTNEAAFNHVSNEMDCGTRYSYSYRVTPKRKFTLSFPVISDAEVATLEAFFISMHGRFGVFQFTDIDGAVYPTVRFDQDVFQVRYTDIGQSSLTLQLVEVGS